MAIDTCCTVEMRLRIGARRCFEKGWEDEHGSDEELAKHFLTEVVFRTQIVSTGPGCPPMSATPDQMNVCQISPGRYISRLQTVWEGEFPWPADGPVELSTLIATACQFVRDNPAGNTSGD